MDPAQGFAALQEQTEFALAMVGVDEHGLARADIAEARAAIKAMRDFVDQAEADLGKLIRWRESANPEVQHLPKRATQEEPTGLPSQGLPRHKGSGRGRPRRGEPDRLFTSITVYQCPVGDHFHLGHPGPAHRLP